MTGSDTHATLLAKSSFFEIQKPSPSDTESAKPPVCFSPLLSSTALLVLCHMARERYPISRGGHGVVFIQYTCGILTVQM